MDQYDAPYGGCFAPLFATISFFKATNIFSIVVSGFQDFSKFNFSTLPVP